MKEEKGKEGNKTNEGGWNKRIWKKREEEEWNGIEERNIMKGMNGIEVEFEGYKSDKPINHTAISFHFLVILQWSKNNFICVIGIDR